MPYFSSFFLSYLFSLSLKSVICYFFFSFFSIYINLRKKKNETASTVNDVVLRFRSVRVFPFFFFFLFSFFRLWRSSQLWSPDSPSRWLLFRRLCSHSCSRGGRSTGARRRRARRTGTGIRWVRPSAGIRSSGWPRASPPTASSGPKKEDPPPARALQEKISSEDARRRRIWSPEKLFRHLRRRKWWR